MADYYTGGTQQNAPNSTMAVVSLVSGILGFTLLPILGSIVALIVGYMAKSEIQNSGGALGGDGLAVAGIVMGWIGVGLAVIGCCIGGAFFLIPACLIPLGISLDQFGTLQLIVSLFI